MRLPSKDEKDASRDKELGFLKPGEAHARLPIPDRIEYTMFVQDEPMWNNMWDMGISAPDKIIRTVVIYLGLAILLRLAGKCDLAQLNSFDLVVMLLLSNVVQNAVIGNDLSLTGGAIGVVGDGKLTMGFSRELFKEGVL